MNRFLKFLFLLCLSLKSFSQDKVKFIVYENYSDFETQIDSIKSIGRAEYVKAINKRLENNEEPFIYGICDLIKQDSLIECIPNLKRYISNCKRKNHNSSECALHRLAEIGSKADQQFILDDFQLHLDKRLNNHGWLQAYISALTELHISNGHDKLDKAFFDWNGIDLNFAEFPKLFDIKKELEKQFSVNFPKALAQEGYKLNNVMAFIDNASEVAKNNGIPKPRYIVEIELPYDEMSGNDKEEASLKKIQELTGLPKENINLKSSSGGYYRHEEERFGTTTGLTVQYIDYLSKYPNAKCTKFIRLLLSRDYFDEYDRYCAEKYLSAQK